jgi:hypothetical protein
VPSRDDVSRRQDVGNRRPHDYRTPSQTRGHTAPTRHIPISAHAGVLPARYFTTSLAAVAFVCELPMRSLALTFMV